ncbi:MAG: alpha/beta fold hydrolase [Streptosporangiaceae bacterium]|nr:alpha/beta fold hydrolase [Streptosporangiaceae bacterium]MBV9856693.1 alpha/beta fold hydrolase [Streptosporangiaceae bacterium]
MTAAVSAVVTAVAAALVVVAVTVPRAGGASAVAARVAVTSSQSALSGYRVTLKWGKCPASVAKAPFQCATAPAPLNYARPGGARIQLALIRLPAAVRKERIGSLFINFGGPGGAGTKILPERATTVFSAAIRDHFDLVSWDTRGTGLSTAVRCFATQQDDSNYFGSVPYFPYPPSTDASFWSLNAQLGKDCQQRAGTLLPHMSSQDTARDLDLLRQDVGDAKLTYMGFSYGTVIGAIYANLFPRNVRAMVFDGSVDFKANAIGDTPGEAQKYPVDVRAGVDVAGQDVLGRFLHLCAKAGSGSCAFAAGGNLPAKWRTLLARSRANPIQYAGGTYFYSTIVAVTYYNLYKPMADWPALATLLQGLYTSSSGATPAMTPQQMYPVNNTNEGYYISQCADIEVPTRESVYDSLAATEDVKVPGFGRFVTYDMTPCGSWPALHTDAYDGPWNRSRATILVINSLHDPATPYPGAVTGARELVNARLITVNGDGHTSEYSEPSTCRDAAKQAYLISLRLPPRGLVCQVNQLPWGLPPGS